MVARNARDLRTDKPIGVVLGSKKNVLRDTFIQPVLYELFGEVSSNQYTWFLVCDKFALRGNRGSGGGHRPEKEPRQQRGCDGGTQQESP